MTAVGHRLARMADLPELRAAYDLISTTYAELLPDTSFEKHPQGFVLVRRA